MLHQTPTFPFIELENSSLFVPNSSGPESSQSVPRIASVQQESTLGS